MAATALPPRRLAPVQRRGRRPLVPVLLAAIAVTLLAGLTGGLLRAGVPLPALSAAHWAGQAAVWHGALMVGGFMGSMVGVERAVALRHPLAWAAPVASASAAAALLLGAPAFSAWLLVVAATAFVGANTVLVQRQPAQHTALLLLAAFAWLAGNVLAVSGIGGAGVLPCWFSFLLLTVAAERLEMTRLLKRRPAAQPLLATVVVALLAAAGWSALDAVAGGVAFGLSLVALAAWLLVFDIARRTARAEGLPRYMALCLLGGYVWLAIGGLAWAAYALGVPVRDAALHAIGLGFLGSMVLGHAPVILPAVARLKLAFGRVFYLPLGALHVSLLVRLGPGLLDAGWRAAGALANVLALATFAVVVASAALAWRRHGSAPRRRERAVGS
ncbi:hypothetical protein ACPWT1_07300 [Ramlibacter sp. MMS24-I3-19]|uniref:hypothetical protein n=1 Tax=Ramlibacter sp. MMS24-I3-19 TaxID=3416606 RepID=UPI003D0349E9